MNKLQLTFVIIFAISFIYIIATKVGVNLETVLVMAGSILSVSGTGLTYSNKRKEAYLVFTLSLVCFGIYFLIYYF